MYRRQKVGLGICCYERPQYSGNSIRSAFEVLDGVLDETIIYEDCSPTKGREYDALFQDVSEWDWTVHPLIERATTNGGVGSAKNHCLKVMMDLGCDYLFLMEDDIVVLSPEAITGYIDTSIRTGIQHFNYAYHGAMNADGPVEIIDNEVEIHRACVGAWSFYTRHSIDVVGYFDEGYRNAFEHCEWTSRAALAGLTTPFWQFADVHGSVGWLSPQVGDPAQDTVIRSSGNWVRDMHLGQKRFRTQHPEVWG